MKKKLERKEECKGVVMNNNLPSLPEEKCLQTMQPAGLKVWFRNLMSYKWWKWQKRNWKKHMEYNMEGQVVSIMD